MRCHHSPNVVTALPRKLSKTKRSRHAWPWYAVGSRRVKNSPNSAPLTVLITALALGVLVVFWVSAIPHFDMSWALNIEPAEGRTRWFPKGPNGILSALPFESLAEIEGGDLFVYCSTQHSGEIQHAVARALDLTQKDVTVECRRMGGAFGGKESQPALIACAAALLELVEGQVLAGGGGAEPFQGRLAELSQLHLVGAAGQRPTPPGQAGCLHFLDHLFGRGVAGLGDAVVFDLADQVVLAEAALEAASRGRHR